MCSPEVWEHLRENTLVWEPPPRTLTLDRAFFKTWDQMKSTTWWWWWGELHCLVVCVCVSLSPSFQAEELNKISSLFQGKKLKSNKPLVVVVESLWGPYPMWALKSFIHSLHSLQAEGIVCVSPKNSTFPNAKKKVLSSLEIW